MDTRTEFEILQDWLGSSLKLPFSPKKGKDYIFWEENDSSSVIQGISPEVVCCEMKSFRLLRKKRMCGFKKGES